MAKPNGNPKMDKHAQRRYLEAIKIQEEHTTDFLLALRKDCPTGSQQYKVRIAEGMAQSMYALLRQAVENKD